MGSPDLDAIPQCPFSAFARHLLMIGEGMHVVVEVGLLGSHPAHAYQAAYDNAIGHFVERLRSKMPFETAPDDNLRSLALVEAAYQVARPPARAGLSPSE